MSGDDPIPIYNYSPLSRPIHIVSAKDAQTKLRYVTMTESSTPTQGDELAKETALPVDREALLYIIAKARDYDLFSDDPVIAHSAASPMTIESARAFHLKCAEPILDELLAATRPEPDYRALALKAVPLISALCTTASRFAAEDWLAFARKEGLIP